MKYANYIYQLLNTNDTLKSNFICENKFFLLLSEKIEFKNSLIVNILNLKIP